MEEEFDQGKYNAFKDNNDYLGAAKYLKKYRNTVSDENLATFDADVLALERKGRIRNAQLNRINDMQEHNKELFLFNEALNSGGVLPEKNRYSDSYKQLLMSLSTSNRPITSKDKAYRQNRINIQNQLVEKSIEKGNFNLHNIIEKTNAQTEYIHNKDNNINVQFDTHDKYVNFLTNSGLNSSDVLLSTGATVEQKDDGTVRMVVNPSNSKLKSILSGLREGLGYFDDDFKLMQDGFENEILGNYEQSLKQITKLYNSTDKAYKELTQSGLSMPTSSTISGYMGANHARLVQLLSSGAIGGTEYEKQLKFLTDSYNNLIQQHSFAKTDMYMYTDTDKGVLLNLVNDSGERDRLGTVIKSAVHDGNRVTYNAANVGGMNGTMITITPHLKEGEYKMSDYDPDEPDPRRGYKIFVPGLFESEAETALVIDSKTRAQTELSNMCAFNYAYPLTQGGEIKPIGDNLFEYNDGASDKVSTIDYALASKYMNKSMILDDGMTAINRYVSNHKITVGPTRDEKKLAAQTPQQRELEARIEAIAKSGAQDVTGAQEGDEYITTWDDIYSYLMVHSGLSGVSSVNNIVEKTTYGR